MGKYGKFCFNSGKVSGKSGRSGIFWATLVRWGKCIEFWVSVVNFVKSVSFG